MSDDKDAPPPPPPPPPFPTPKPSPEQWCDVLFKYKMQKYADTFMTDVEKLLESDVTHAIFTGSPEQIKTFKYYLKRPPKFLLVLFKKKDEQMERHIRQALLQGKSYHEIVSTTLYDIKSVGRTEKKMERQHLQRIKKDAEEKRLANLSPAERAAELGETSGKQPESHDQIVRRNQRRDKEEIRTVLLKDSHAADGALLAGFDPLQVAQVREEIQIKANLSDSERKANMSDAERKVEELREEEATWYANLTRKRKEASEAEIRTVLLGSTDHNRLSDFEVEDVAIVLAKVESENDEAAQAQNAILLEEAKQPLRELTAEISLRLVKHRPDEASELYSKKHAQLYREHEDCLQALRDVVYRYIDDDMIGIYFEGLVENNK